MKENMKMICVIDTFDRKNKNINVINLLKVSRLNLYE